MAWPAGLSTLPRRPGRSQASPQRPVLFQRTASTFDDCPATVLRPSCGPRPLSESLHCPGSFPPVSRHCLASPTSSPLSPAPTLPAAQAGAAGPPVYLVTCSGPSGQGGGPHPSPRSRQSLAPLRQPPLHSADDRAGRPGGKVALMHMVIQAAGQPGGRLLLQLRRRGLLGCGSGHHQHA